MVYNVRLSEPAEKDFHEIENFAWLSYSGDSEALMELILGGLNSLDHNPQRCPVDTSLNRRRQIRKLNLLIGSDAFVVYFEIQESTIFVLRIRHSARKPLRRL
jgi:plasmid stabilization system protein ParE